MIQILKANVTGLGIGLYQLAIFVGVGINFIPILENAIGYVAVEA